MTEETLVRKAESRDLEDIVAIIKDAKALLKAQKSSQWQEGYPNRASIEEDLDNKQGWVLLKEGQVAAYMAATDFDPNYEVPIWAGSGRYWALHRFAIKKDFRGQGLSQLLLKRVIASILCSSQRLSLFTPLTTLPISNTPKSEAKDVLLLT